MEQVVGTRYCCLIQYVVALAEYAESERAKRGRGVLLAEAKYRRRRFRQLLSLVAVIL